MGFAEFALADRVPEGLTPQALAAAVQEHRTLRGLADALDVDRQLLRALLYDQDLYTTLDRPEGRPGRHGG